MIGASIILPAGTPSFDDQMRADLTAQRDLDRLTADAPLDVRLRASARAVQGREFVLPRQYQRGRRPRPPSSPAPILRGATQTIVSNPPRRTP
jgi:hypothetical protein